MAVQMLMDVLDTQLSERPAGSHGELHLCKLSERNVIEATVRSRDCTAGRGVFSTGAPAKESTVRVLFKETDWALSAHSGWEQLQQALLAQLRLHLRVH